MLGDCGSNVYSLDMESARMARVKVPFRQRYRTSRMIFGQSWSLVRSERRLWRFPLISGLVFMAMMALIGFVTFLTKSWTYGPFGMLVTLPVIMVIGFPFGYVMSLLNAAFCFGIHERMTGRRCSPSEAWQRARSQSGVILRFSLLAALVGGVLAIVGQVLNKLRLVPWLGTAVQMLGSYGWAVASYFVIPIMVVEREQHSLQALKGSVTLAREQWGKSTAGIVTIGLALLVPFMVVLLALTLLMFGGMAIVFATKAGAVIPVLLTAFIVAMAAMLVLMMTAASATGVTYQTALYRYARTGAVTSPFTSETLVDAWTPYKQA